MEPIHKIPLTEDPSKTGGYNVSGVVMLSMSECKALYDLISQLSGCNPENVFSWDGTDDLGDPAVSACAKVYRAIGRKVPDFAGFPGQWIDGE